MFIKLFQTLIKHNFTVHLIIIFVLELVTGLEAHPIIHVSCGHSHSLALNKWGHLHAWGSDSYGQLGHQMGQTIQATPKIIKTMAAYTIVQVACGDRHTVVLTNCKLYRSLIFIFTIGIYCRWGDFIIWS